LNIAVKTQKCESYFYYMAYGYVNPD